jgi:hypothetical protein
LSRKIVVAAVLLALVSAGCGSSRDALTIYSGRTQNLVGPLPANKPRTYANNNAVVEAVSRGEFQMGLVDHHHNHRFRQESPGTPSRNHGFAGDDVGALVIPTTAMGGGRERTVELIRSSGFDGV